METLDANALGHACAAASVPRPRYLQQKHARLLSSSPDAATPPRSSIAPSRRNSAAAALLGFSLRHGFLPVEPRSPLGGGARTRSTLAGLRGRRAARSPTVDARRAHRLSLAGGVGLRRGAAGLRASGVEYRQLKRRSSHSKRARTISHPSAQTK